MSIARCTTFRDSLRVMQALVVFLACLSTDAMGALFENNPTFQALEAAWKTWKDSVEFTCVYVMRDGSAKTKEAALAGHFGSLAGAPKAENYATGSFYKLGNKIRYSEDFSVHSLRETESNEDAEDPLFFDEIATGTICLAGHRKNNGRLCAIVTPRPDALTGKVVAGTKMQSAFHPLSAGLKLDGTLSEFLAPRPSYDEKISESTIVKPDASHIDVRVVKTFRVDSDTMALLLRFRTDTSPPVLERIEGVNDFPSRGTRQECVVSFEDFVECKGGLLMPRCVRKTFGPIVPVGKDEPVWAVTEWKSNNLGESPPTDDDFVYTAPVDSLIVGLNARVPIVDGTYVLDMSNYTSADFAFMPDGSIVARQQFPPSTRSKASPTRRIILVSSGVLLVVLVFTLVWKHRK